MPRGSLQPRPTPMASATADRTRPNVALAVPALGGLAPAMLSSLVQPPLPENQHLTTETGITWSLTGVPKALGGARGSEEQAGGALLEGARA